jgi:murein endopeptidase
VWRLQSKWILIAAVGVGAATARNVTATVPDGALSLGYPNGGRLVGGKQFHETPYMVMVPAHANSHARWALPAVLSVLDRASRIVGYKFPGSVLEIGELSRRDGGPIASHRSHQNGRDADVGFYLVDLDGQPIRAPKFMRCDGSGEGRDDPTVRFDEERNWAFVDAILGDPRGQVRQIFIYAPLRARLLAYAAKIGAPRALRAKAAAAMMQPMNVLPHDDHFHIRISCPADQLDRGCADLPLWRAPGSPDDVGPELLAEAPRVRPARLPNAFPPEGWCRISKLWSIERSVCEEDLTCTDRDDGPACEDLGDFGLQELLPPPDEMGMPTDNVVAVAARGPDAIACTPMRTGVSMQGQSTMDELRAEHFGWRTTPNDGFMLLGVRDGQLVRFDAASDDVGRLMAYSLDYSGSVVPGSLWISARAHFHALCTIHDRDRSSLAASSLISSSICSAK